MRRRAATQLLVAALACLAQACKTPKHETPKATTMITYEAQPETEEIPIAGEVRLRLRIVNTTGAAASVPDPTAAGAQPVYVVKGPEYPEGHSFTRLELTPPEASGAQPSAPPAPAMLHIEAGATWEATVGFGEGLKLTAPGDYMLVSRFEHGGGWVESRASVLRVRVSAPPSIHMGFGVRPQQSGEGEGAFLQRDKDASRLFAFSFHETRPDIHEAELGELIERGVLGAGATDVGVPWRNSPFFNEMIRFIVWREGRSVKVISSTNAVSSMDLPVEPTSLVRPPLKTTGGPVEVLAATDGELQLVSFALGAAPADPAVPKLGWKAALPAKPAAIAAALGPEARKSPRYVALAAPRERGIELFHARYAAGGALGPWRSLVIEDAGRLLDPNAFGVFVDADENVFVGALTLTERDGSFACAWTEARWDAGGSGQGKASGMPLGALAEKPAAGALLFVETEGKLSRREAVVAVNPEKGQLLRFKEPRGLVPVSVPGRPTSPILLVPGDTATYILYFDPTRGIYAEPL